MYRITSTTPRTAKPASEDEDILRWLRRFKYDPQFQDATGAPAVPMSCFCEFSGISRPTLYRFMRGLPVSALVKQKIAVAIKEVVSGLRWRRMADHAYVPNDPERYKKFPRFERPARPKPDAHT